MTTVLAPRSAAEVFSVEPDAVQVTWRCLEPYVDLRLDGKVVDRRDAATASAVLDVHGPGGHLLEIEDCRGIALSRPFEVPLPPDGPELCRFATISDMHFGATGFGLVRPVPNEDRALERCARTAVADLVAWGAELLVIKGDLTQKPQPATLRMVREFVDDIPIPVVVMIGNHDVQVSSSYGIGRENALAHGFGRSPVQVVDLLGVRVVTADTTVDGHGYGRLTSVLDELVAAVRVDRPVFLALHHHLMRTALPYFWPPGIPKRQSDRVVRTLGEANDRIFISSGHTHRARRHRRRGLPVTEVGSVKDYPGVWAGYRVYDGGLVQVMRRQSDPASFVWTEQTRAAVAGIWPRWSPGLLDDRSFVHLWTPSATPREPTGVRHRAHNGRGSRSL